MSEITRGVMGMPYEMVMSSEISRRQFYSIAREVYAESERLSSALNQANHMLADAEAENESLRKDAERYRKFRALTLNGLDDTPDEFDAEFDSQINRSPENP
jgi:hypothetical protein